MKRTLPSICALLLLLASSAFAEGDKAYTKNLVSKGLNAEFGAIQDSAQELTREERLSVFDSCKKDTLTVGGLGAGVNFLVGFGIGSYVIGDISGGILGTCLDLGATAVTITGVVMVWYPIIQMFSSITDGSYYSSSSSLNPFTYTSPGYVLILIGWGISSVSRIVQLVTPFVYVNSYNKRLEDALLISLGAERMEPALAYAREDGSAVPALGMKLFL